MFVWILLTNEKRRVVVKEYNDKNKDVSKVISENINFAIEVKKNLKEQNSIKEVEKNIVEDLRLKFKQKFIFELKNNMFIRGLFILVGISIPALSMYLYFQNELTVGGVSAIMGYAITTVGHARWIFEIFNQ
jgi:ABC-type multidrug transport system fused ATPase/permease subunit